jgi:hypothetical protein
MRIEINPFPVVHFHGVCKKHDCGLFFNVQGGQIIVTACAKAGGVHETDCQSDWVMTIAGGGDITITK